MEARTRETLSKSRSAGARSRRSALASSGAGRSESEVSVTGILWDALSERASWAQSSVQVRNGSTSSHARPYAGWDASTALQPALDHPGGDDRRNRLIQIMRHDRPCRPVQGTFPPRV